MRRFCVLLFAIFGLITSAYTQNQIGSFAPEFTLAHKLNKTTGLTFKTEVFQRVFEENTWGMDYKATDIQFFINKKLNPFVQFSLGYQIGLSKGTDPSHRFIQQLSYSNSTRLFKYSHRFRVDETFYSHRSPKFRLRYRLATEIPLQGNSLDTGEWYMILSDELIFSTQASVKEFENRANGQLGFMATKMLKLQAGIDWRTTVEKTAIENHWLIKAGIFLNL